MICLRCGYCCQTSSVVVVNDPEKGIVEGNLLGVNFDLDKKQKCSHLRGEKPGEFSCAIHDEKWYDETPCFSHGQIEQNNINCRMGDYVLQQEKQHA